MTTSTAEGTSEAPLPRRRVIPAWIWAPIGALVVVLAGVGAWAVASPGPQVPTAKSGLPVMSRGADAPAFRLANLRGGSDVSLPAGRPVMLNFFASWCSNCQSEISAFAATSRTAGGRLEVIGIDVNDTDHAAARRLLAAGHATYPVGVDDSGATTGEYRVVALPTTIFLDRDGRVAGEVFGAQTRASLARWAAKLGA